MSETSLDMVKERFLDYLKEAGKAPATITNYSRTLTYFCRFLKEKGVSSITEIPPDIIQEYQNYVYKIQDKAEETLKFYIKDIKRFFDYLIKMGVASCNPALGIKVKPKTIETVELITRYYSIDEIFRKYRHYLKDKDISFSFYQHETAHINSFIFFLEKENINSIYKVSPSLVDKYKEYLNSSGYNGGKILNIYDQIEKLRSLRRFYKWLIKEKIHKFDPTRHLRIGEHGRYLKENGNGKDKTATIPPQTQIQIYQDKFLEYKKSLGLSHRTIGRVRTYLNIFIRYLKSKDIVTIEAVKKEDILSYLNYLSNGYKTHNGKYLTQSTKSGLIGAVKNFFQFLVRFEYLEKDPTVHIDSLKPDNGLPRTLMSQREVDILLDMPDLSTVIGIRDKAILETLYSTGMRASELCSLRIDDIDFTQGFVRINHPKGGRPQERIVPIGKVALHYITEYLNNARKHLLNGSPDILFLSKRGKILTHDDVCSIVKGYVFKAHFKKNITSHSFRVTCATEMLKNKADIRYVQQQLGHKKITSTQLYARVIPIDLKKVHSETHPRERHYRQEQILLYK